MNKERLFSQNLIFAPFFRHLHTPKMGNSASSSVSSFSAAYRESLLTSVFLDDGDVSELGVVGKGGSRSKGKTIDMEKMTMLIWSFRDSPEMVTFISNFLAKVCTHKEVCLRIYIMCCVYV